jgi:hypothetical protein
MTQRRACVMLPRETLARQPVDLERLTFNKFFFHSPGTPTGLGIILSIPTRRFTTRSPEGNPKNVHA